MDIKQLFKDIASFNLKSFRLRFLKLKAVLKRSFLLSRGNNYGNGKDIKQIPIILNNRNQYSYLLKLIDWLARAGYHNIYIIDNDSTYPPLLNYYSTTKYPVFYLKENVGHLSLWKSGLINQFEKDYYIYSDPDVLPIEECPADVIEFLMKKLIQFPEIEKIGLGLKIDDLPNHYINKEKVVAWEGKYWEKEVEKDIFDAELDTTFALYRPYTNGGNWVQKAYRTGGKYIVRHLPWYEDSNNETEESLFYKKEIKKGSSHWMVEKK